MSVFNISPMEGPSVVLHHQPRWPIEDVIVRAVKIRPMVKDIDEMFTMAEKAFARYGLKYDVVSHALARYDYLRFRDIINLASLKLTTEEAAAAELLRYVIALADNLAYASLRPTSP